MFMFTFTCSP